MDAVEKDVCGGEGGTSLSAGMFTGNSLDVLLCASEMSWGVDASSREDMCAMSKSSVCPGTCAVSECRDENATVSCAEGASVCAVGGVCAVPASDVGTLGALDFG